MLTQRSLYRLWYLSYTRTTLLNYSTYIYIRSYGTDFYIVRVSGTNSTYRIFYVRSSWYSFCCFSVLSGTA